MSAATDLAISDPDSCCWHAHGWENAGECSVQSAEGRTRAQARSAFNVWGEGAFVEIGVWKRYIRPFTVQEQWDRHRSVADSETPPPGWSCESPCWEFVRKGTPGAWPVWVCGLSELGPPESPSVPEGSAEA